MATARREEDWRHTAWLCHVIINAAPFREGPSVSPDECNPLLDDDQRPGSGIDCLDPAALGAYFDAVQLRNRK